MRSGEGSQICMPKLNVSSLLEKGPDGTHPVSDSGIKSEEAVNRSPVRIMGTKRADPEAME